MINRKNIKKITALLLSVFVVGATFTGFTFNDGFGYVYYDSKMDIHNDVYYNDVIGNNVSHGMERAYFVTAGPGKTVQPYVYSGYSIGKTTMDTMVSNINQMGYRVVAGINGDLYDTGSGTPKGVVIHDGKLCTTGYSPGKSIAFTADGKAFVGNGAPEIILSGSIVKAGGTTAPWITPVGFLNVPHGGGKALHLYNSYQGKNTGVKESSCEVVIDIAGTKDLIIGNNIKGIVRSVKKNTGRTPIGSNQVVLSCAMDSVYMPNLSALAVGSEITLSVEAKNTGLENAKEAIGAYHLLAENGKIITTGTGINPRTCVGIKPDGSLVMYVVDGRQKWTVSAGLSLTEVAKHLISLGCTTVFNMDGGGSSNISIRMPGKDVFAKVVNSVSDKTQRRTANGLFLVYVGKGNKTLQNLSVYPAFSLMMPGASLQLTTYGTDDKYEPVLLSVPPVYSVNAEHGNVSSSGVFTAGNKLGMAEISVQSVEKVSGCKVNIVKDITIIPSHSKLNMKPGQSKDINIYAKFGTAPVISKDSLFNWSCDKNIGTISNNGVFKSANVNAQGNITVSYNNKSVKIPVNVTGAIPMGKFYDISGHWAENYINQLASKNLVNGTGNNMFSPEMKLTRSQFLAMLAKLSGEDVTKAAPAGFKDVPKNEWYYTFVNWGSAAGIVKGTDTGLFMPNKIITREQMAVMLDKYMEYKKLNLSKNININFADKALISEWAKDSVTKAVDAGILVGKDGGVFDPLGSATRAEAATVIWKLYQH